MKKVAIMQPYFLPYIGYFQLIKAVDVFVFYDDVTFIKQGWINRNRILVSGKEFVFTIPLKGASSFVTIKETGINDLLFMKWKTKFLKTIEQSYKKSPFFDKIYSIIAELLHRNFDSISDLAIESIIKISNYLNLDTHFECSSLKYHDTRLLDREKRLVEIIKRNDSDFYVNTIGGVELYTKEAFAQNGIHLNFIKSKQISYKQFETKFVPWLSIIDVLMFNDVEQINIMLDQYEFCR